MSVSASGIFKSTCYIDVRWFPFDVQRCDLKFGSWTYGGWSLDLQMIEADITGYIANGEWDLVGKTHRHLHTCRTTMLAWLWMPSVLGPAPVRPNLKQTNKDPSCPDRRLLICFPIRPL